MLFSLPFQENGLLVFNQVSVEVDLDLGLHVRHSLLGSGLAQFQQLKQTATSRSTGIPHPMTKAPST